jgi:hypothetical protein
MNILRMAKKIVPSRYRVVGKDRLIMVAWQDLCSIGKVCEVEPNWFTNKVKWIVGNGEK